MPVETVPGWRMEIRISTRMLVEFTRIEWETFLELTQNGWHIPWSALGFEKRPVLCSTAASLATDEFVIRVETDEVVKPVLLGHELPYSVERVV